MNLPKIHYAFLLAAMTLSLSTLNSTSPAIDKGFIEDVSIVAKDAIDSAKTTLSSATATTPLGKLGRVVIKTGATMAAKVLMWQFEDKVLALVPTAHEGWAKPNYKNGLWLNIALHNSIPDVAGALAAFAFDGYIEDRAQTATAGMEPRKLEIIGCGVAEALVATFGGAFDYEANAATKGNLVCKTDARFIAVGSVLRLIENGTYKNVIPATSEIMPLFESIEKLLSSTGFDLDGLNGVNLSDGVNQSKLITKILCKFLSPLTVKKLWNTNSERHKKLRTAIAGAILAPIIAQALYATDAIAQVKTNIWPA